MKRKRYADEQIAFALRQAEGGTSVEEICRKMGVSEPTFYRWKKQFAGMGVAEIRRLKRICQGSRLATRLAGRGSRGRLRDQRGGNRGWTAWPAAPPP
jgi:putative transposase